MAGCHALPQDTTQDVLAVAHITSNRDTGGEAKKHTIDDNGEREIVVRQRRRVHTTDLEIKKQFEANGEAKKGCDINGEREIVVTRTDLEIKEQPEAANGNLTGEKEVYMEDVLVKHIETWMGKTKYHLGYPGNLDFNYDALGDRLQQFLLNNCGDPFIEGNYGMHTKDFEVAVLDWFAHLWEIEKDQYWGYVTNGGTEGNFHGLLIGREMFPDGILYTSKESHYSVFKAAHMYRMDCIKVDTLVSGEIDYGDLKTRLLENKDKPAIITLTIGTTVKGGVDNIDLVIKTLKECGIPRNRFYIHCDGALFGLMLPFINRAPQVTFKKPIDSVTISGHKFVGCPITCGIQIVRKQHINVLAKNVEYIASRDITIMGSRNGQAPIFLWYALNRKGYNGFRKEVQKCMQNARYLRDRLIEVGVSVMLNELSNTVVFERPKNEEFILHWQLSCQGNIAHVVVMPNVTVDKLDMFVDEMVEKRLSQSSCVAFEIGKENCVCSLH